MATWVLRVPHKSVHGLPVQSLNHRCSVSLDNEELSLSLSLFVCVCVCVF